MKNLKLKLVACSLILVIAACGTGGGTAPAGGGAAPAGGGAAPAAPAAPGTPAADGEDVEILVSWWGGEARHALFNEIWDSFEDQHPGITVVRQFALWGDYWTRLLTQAAGGALPDVFAIGPQNRSDFAVRGFMHPLDEFIADGTIDTSNFSAGSLTQGIFAPTGDTYIITFGDTVSIIAYNRSLLERVGMPSPRGAMTYSEFIDFAVELQSLLPDDVWASNGNLWEHQFVNHVRQFGGLIVDEVNGARQIGFAPEHLASYYQFYQTKMDLGIAPPPEVTAENIGRVWIDSLEGSGRLAMWHTNANQMKIFQSQTDDVIGGIRPLIADGATHRYIEEMQPSGWAIAATSTVKPQAAGLINWFSNDVPTQVKFNMELGVPVSNNIQDTIINNLTDSAIDNTIRIEIDLVNLIGATADPKPWRLEGSAAIWGEVADTWSEIMFGMISIDEAVSRVFERAPILIQ